MLPDADKNILFLDTGKTRLLLGQGRQPKKYITSVRRVVSILLFNGYYVLVDYHRCDMTAYNSYQTYSPHARGDFLNSFASHLRQIVGTSAIIKRI